MTTLRRQMIEDISLTAPDSVQPVILSRRRATRILNLSAVPATLCNSRDSRKPLIHHPPKDSHRLGLAVEEVLEEARLV